MLDDNELLFDELYEETKDCGRVQFINLIMNLQKENQELKKELSNSHQIKNQQKEFIEWLESNLEALEMCDRELILTNNKKEIKAYKEVLSKYKEIIGGSNANISRR